MSLNDFCWIFIFSTRVLDIKEHKIKEKKDNLVTKTKMAIKKPLICREEIILIYFYNCVFKLTQAYNYTSEIYLLLMSK